MSNTLLPAFRTPAQPPHVDPGLALVRAVPPNAAALVHNAIMDMLSVPAARPPR